LDFANLLIAPLAALITLLVIGLSVLTRPRSEDKSLVWAYGASLMCASVFVVQPWYFTSQRALTDGILALLILSTFGFAVGAFAGLVIVKGARWLKALFGRQG
jgi:hypothetical protein